jgi:hypothetical protein
MLECPCGSMENIELQTQSGEAVVGVAAGIAVARDKGEGQSERNENDELNGSKASQLR